MNKQRKQTLMALFIVLIFGMSSFAFVLNFVTPETAVVKLNSFIIDGDVRQDLEYQYIQNGFTFLRYYYTDTVPDYVNQLPDIFITNTGQKQLYVLKIAANDTYISVRSANGEVTANATEEDVFNSLCSTLLVTPSECGLMTILQNTVNQTINTTNNSTNATSTNTTF
jgi:hypothetical protein